MLLKTQKRQIYLFRNIAFKLVRSLLHPMRNEARHRCGSAPPNRMLDRSRITRLSRATSNSIQSHVSTQPRQPLATRTKGVERNFNNVTASRADKAEYPNLLFFDEMPDWLRRESNQWILHAYQPISGSIHDSFCSLSYLHNESVNIYSHLIPALLFLLGEWCIQQYLTRRYSRITTADLVAFSIFMIAAATCLFLSAMYHTFTNHSQHVEHICLRLDMLSVVIFIFGDLVLGIYVVFWCEPLPRNTYWYMVSQPLSAQSWFALYQT